MQKTIYSLPASRELLEASTGAIWSFCPQLRILATDAINSTSSLFDTDDEALFSAIARDEFNIGAMQNKALRRFLPDKNSGRVSRLLKRLRVHDPKRSAVITTGRKLRELVIHPATRPHQHQVTPYRGAGVNSAKVAPCGSAITDMSPTFSMLMGPMKTCPPSSFALAVESATFVT